MGEENYKEYRTKAWVDRLKQDWPEDPQQLHSGGWDITHELVEMLSKRLGKKSPEDVRVLDLCCGEGVTAMHIAKVKPWEVYGVDISEPSITAAKASKSKVNFVCEDATKMSFEDGFFDVVIGQDPDVFSEAPRLACMKECFRILKAGGFLAFHHHWIPGRNWKKADLEEYCKTTGIDLDTNGDSYIRDLETAGFDLDLVEDIDKLAESHLTGQYERMTARVAKEGGTVQPWLKTTVEYIKSGHKFGIKVIAVKP